MTSSRHVPFGWSRLALLAVLGVMLVSPDSPASAQGLARVLLVGDSIAEGIGLTRGTSTPAAQMMLYRERTMKTGEVAWNVHAFTVTGTSYAYGAAEAVLAMEIFLPGHVTIVVQWGTNDSNGTMPSTELRQRVIERTSVMGHPPVGTATVVCVTPIPRKDEGPNRFEATLADYRDAIREGCKANGYPVIEGTSFGLLLSRDYQPDGVHLNDRGSQRFAQALVRALVPYVK